MVTWVGLLILTAITLTLIIAAGINQLACEGQPINNNVEPTDAQQIWGEQAVGQTFVAPRPNLNRIDIFFQTYRRQNTHDVTFQLLEVTDATNPHQGIERFKATFNAASVWDQSWRTFDFAPLPDSAGKTYLIRLESPESKEGDAITVGGIERDVYVRGSAYLGPTPLLADIAFRSCYQLTTLEKLQVLAGQITRNRPGWWGDIMFYGLILLIYGVLLGGLFWSLGRLPTKSP